MTNVIEMKLRPSDVVLDRVFNPAADDQLGGATPAQLAEACGIIPDFFCQACLMAAPLTLDNIAAGMDSVYQFGGFNAYPFKGSIDDHDGTYQSEHDDDDALPPLARFIFEGFECFVYEYGIAAIRDRATRATKIARFD
jgi:hypothetical protein